MSNTQHPLILVFYLDGELMKNPQIMQPFADYVNDMIEQKNANMMVFFLPTTGEERVECINPVLVSEPDMEKINLMIEDIKTQFSVGLEENKETVTCPCGKLTDSECKCDNE